VERKNDFAGLGDWLPSSLKCVCGNFQIFARHGFTSCGKIPKVSFRGRGLPEESAFFLGLAKKQIPRFARDDIDITLFRILFSRRPI
jgi:hypothetical protein